MTFPIASTACKFAALPALALLLAGCPAASGPTGDPGPQHAELQCPQPRDTQRAPDTYQALTNPLAPSAENLAQGRALYQADRPGGSCASCHGSAGDGRGPAGAGLVPPPRDFTCAPTMAPLSDGQLFWITKYGSGAFHVAAGQGSQQVSRPGRRENPTAMAPYDEQLSDAEIWQLVLYMRSFLDAPAAQAP
ncbi:cytochrome c [Thioalkalivibrio sp. XN279]|uniref:c-type cytochrome n=1 Tax=Thioalkalivibrio sp. XN279 TaxID=2714953 RepID=UPI00140E8B73|nr:cytochrome c [Thioalkalivibrio sp. XN279]NHA15645.1 cytochrome c [Thioalkalivibrio sp. XN279]